MSGSTRTTDQEHLQVILKSFKLEPVDKMITEAVVNLMFLSADEQSGRSNRGVGEAARSLLPAKSCWSVGPKPTESPCLMILRNVDILSLCPGSV